YTMDPFQNPNDNYSLLSYCSVKNLPFSINEYVYNNKRVKTFNDFEEKLNQPIKILLRGE
ncbi:MAG: hypothetical protein SGI74_13965, partial [Oligoflexia bacterium]|nr:hypothetical protein [Oligoflexia bacterium]